MKARGEAIRAWFACQWQRYRQIRGRRFIETTVAVLLLTSLLNPELLAVVGQQLFRPMAGAVFGLILQLIFVPYRDDVAEKPDLERYYDRRSRLMGLCVVGFCLVP